MRLFSIIFMSALLVIGGTTSAFAGEKQQKTRDSIDAMEEHVLERLFKEKEQAKELYDKCYGYAVFNSMKVAIMVTTAHGKGVAVHKESGTRTYMKMGSIGVNIGYGLQKMHVIFLFQTQEVFDNFVNKGWRADAEANIAVAKKGGALDAEFKNGVAVYQFTDKGLMLQANISGTKYMKSKKLNRG